MVRDAVSCHFDEAGRPGIIRLHFVREEVLAASEPRATCMAKISSADSASSATRRRGSLGVMFG
ncbi:MAG: hypothetical protein ACI9BV_003133 [Rhodothermales bacterium]|jgi:hypothetical protein